MQENSMEKKEIQDKNLLNSENNKEEPFSRRKIGAVLFGALLGVSALTKEKAANALGSTDSPMLAKIDATLVAMAANVTTVAEAVRKELDNFNTFIKPFMDTVDNVKKVGDSWNALIDHINKVMDATEKSRDFLHSMMNKDSNIFYVQAKQLADYVTNLASGNSDWAKVRLKRFDWYSQALVRALNDISSHYQDIYHAWERASKAPGGNKGNPESRIFIAGANQQLKAVYHEVRSIAFQTQFEDIQKKVSEDKKLGKLPKDKSESEVIADLTKQMMVQLQIAQYSAQIEILNSVNILILSKNANAFTIPRNMKMPKPDDFIKAFNAACNGDVFPGNFKDKS